MSATGPDWACHDVDTVSATVPCLCAGARKLMVESVCFTNRRTADLPRCTVSTPARCAPRSVTVPPAVDTAVRGVVSVGVWPVIGRTAPRYTPSCAITDDNVVRLITEPLCGASITVP